MGFVARGGWIVEIDILGADLVTDPWLLLNLDDVEVAA
jgi:hypothetical protein